MTATWLLIGLAVLLLPGAALGEGRVRSRHTRIAADDPGRSSLSPAVLAVALVGVAGGSIALWGMPVGAVTAGCTCPGLIFGLRRLDSRTREPPPGPTLALVLDLAAAALRAGRPPADALTAAVSAADLATRKSLLRVAGLLRLGAEPAQAWSVVGAKSALGPLAAVAVRSASSGMRLAAAFERHAVQIRSDLATTAVERAHRAGVLALAPLGLCFLPSFVCLGVIPVVVGIARAAFRGLG